MCMCVLRGLEGDGFKKKNCVKNVIYVYTKRSWAFVCFGFTLILSFTSVAIDLFFLLFRFADLSSSYFFFFFIPFFFLFSVFICLLPRILIYFISLLFLLKFTTFRVLGIDVTNHLVSLPPSFRGIGSKYCRPSSPPFGCGSEQYRVLNAFVEVDVPGEYAIDFERKQMLFYLPDSSNGSDASIALNNAPMIVFDSASNIALRGIDIVGSLGDGIDIIDSENISVLILGKSTDSRTEYICHKGSHLARALRIEGPPYP